VHYCGEGGELVEVDGDGDVAKFQRVRRVADAAELGGGGGGVLDEASDILELCVT